MLTAPRPTQTQTSLIILHAHSFTHEKKENGGASDDNVAHASCDTHDSSGVYIVLSGENFDGNSGAVTVPSGAVRWRLDGGCGCWSVGRRERSLGCRGR
ncbi:hypothetical protein VIGAN_01482900 [Vigna angularis var. angularis]|uniref:Uncharacterized protein n=1 Tax=Vigna angularis var. angularis TaxID=157739 RepID=A0A0S3R815_PHAAN|nr:hypothetical protein VIGAN_01482900 [Vigna angularis var. angularis]